MGSTGGKYNCEYGNSSENRNTILPSNSNQSKNESASLPRFIHQHLLTDSLSSNKDNLTIVWLDNDIHNQPSNIDIQIKLKNLSNYLRIFDEVNAFEQYIIQINEEKLFIIISPTLALTMIPRLHRHSQIKCIYIFGKVKINPKTHQELLKKYPKVV
jgi:hypothetical protein